MPTTILSEKGQIVIPAEIRMRLGLQRGDRFEVDARADELILKRLPRNPLLDLKGAFKGPDSLIETLLQEHESERQSDRD